MLPLNLPFSGWKSCLSFNQTEMPGVSGLPMVTLRSWLSSHKLSDHNCTQTSGEGTRAKTSNAVSLCPFNLNGTIDTQLIMCPAFFQGHSITHSAETGGCEIAGHRCKCSALLTVCSLSYGVIMGIVLGWLCLKTYLAMCAAEPSLSKVFSERTNPRVLLIFAELIWMQPYKKRI